MVEDYTLIEELFNLERENTLEIKLQQVESVQKEIKWSMRAILIDWMSEVAYDFDLGRDTFYYAVKYVDMCLARRQDMEKNKFQMFGLTCLFLACKMEEILPPSIDHMVELGSGMFLKSEIYVEEVDIMKALGWKMRPITLNHWLNLLTHLWDKFSFASRRLKKVVDLVELEGEKEVNIRFREPSSGSYKL